MAKAVTPFLMFEGQANEAITLYASVFEDIEVLEHETYGPGEPGPEGTVKRALFSLHGQSFLAIDSPVEHDFGFTPSFSIFVECESEEELRDIFERLSPDGQVMMPIDNYGFSSLFAWTSDRFGVSWQLNLE